MYRYFLAIPNYNGVCCNLLQGKREKIAENKQMQKYVKSRNYRLLVSKKQYLRSG
jgi:hypothetical protein